MAFPHKTHTCLTILFLFFVLSPIEARNGNGFAVKLIPKNSTKNSYRPNTAISSVYFDNMNSMYLMELSIGTPPVTQYAAVDTGSDLIWFQCVPCFDCFEQINPKFDPINSTTYTNIKCGTDSCNNLEFTACSSDQNNCQYICRYVDSSVSNGVLAQETVTLKSTTGEPVSFPGIIFGCGHNNNGTSFDSVDMGIVGLGRGAISLISQIGSSLGGKRFSQCLVPYHTYPNITSHMCFGIGCEVLGEDVVSTPLVSNKLFSYIVTLLGISVDKVYLPYKDDHSFGPSEMGNIIIDSGTKVTMLPEQFYQRLLEQVKSKISMEPIPDSPKGYQLCYRTPTNLKGPTLTVHFEGANVVLTPAHIFIPIEDGVFCFAFVNAGIDGFAIYGNYAQSNYLIGFDLDTNVMSFKPTDCTKF